MNKCIVILMPLLMAVAPMLTACGPENEPVPEPPVVPPVSDSEQPDANGNLGNGSGDVGNEMMRNIAISVDGHRFAATLEDNDAARAFYALLPMTVTMNELNGNEKYYVLNENLPTDTFRPGIIRAGDLLLWGGNTVVLFYDTFSSSYGYTRLGWVVEGVDLSSILGGGEVTVTFEPGDVKRNATI